MWIDLSEQKYNMPVYVKKTLEKPTAREIGANIWKTYGKSVSISEVWRVHI